MDIRTTLTLMKEHHRLPHAILCELPHHAFEEALKGILYVYTEKEVHINHPDIHVVQKDTRIRVEDIASIAEFVTASPSELPYRIYVIYHADRLTDVAANKLLKLLEEPDGAKIAILQTTKPQRMLSTVYSRVQHIQGLRARDFKYDEVLHEWDTILRYINFENVPEKEQKKLVIAVKEWLFATEEEKYEYMTSKEKTIFVDYFEQSIEIIRSLLLSGCLEEDETIPSFAKSYVTALPSSHVYLLIEHCTATLQKLYYNVNKEHTAFAFMLQFEKIRKEGVPYAV